MEVLWSVSKVDDHTSFWRGKNSRSNGVSIFVVRVVVREIWFFSFFVFFVPDQVRPQRVNAFTQPALRTPLESKLGRCVKVAHLFLFPHLFPSSLLRVSVLPRGIIVHSNHQSFFIHFLLKHYFLKINLKYDCHHATPFSCCVLGCCCCV